MKLKLKGEEVLVCSYTTSEGGSTPSTFKRRAYWTPKEY